MNFRLLDSNRSYERSEICSEFFVYQDIGHNGKIIFEIFLMHKSFNISNNFGFSFVILKWIRWNRELVLLWLLWWQKSCINCEGTTWNVSRWIGWRQLFFIENCNENCATNGNICYTIFYQISNMFNVYMLNAFFCYHYYR